MSYAIMRTAKLKTVGNVAGACAHIERTIDTPNADPARTPQNEWLIGGANMLAEAQKTWEKLDRKPRKNAVHGIEVLMTASPEIFEKEKNNPEFINEFKRKSVEWLKQEFESKGAKIVGANLQLDESTPHIQAIIIPTTHHERLGSGLACVKYLGGRQRLRDLQDSYASIMRPLGLQRGLKGSKATHERVKNFYSAIDSNDIPKFKMPRSHKISRKKSGFLAGREDVEVVDKIDIKRVLEKQGKKVRDLAKIGIMHERANRQLKKSNNLLAQRLNDVAARNNSQQAENQQLANLARALPLDMILQKLGYRRNEAGEWVGRNLRLSVTDQKFWDLDRKIGGGGAIDLAKHLLTAEGKSADFKSAVSALSTRFGLTHETSIDLKKSITEQHRPPEVKINSDSLDLENLERWRRNRQSTEPPQKIRSNRLI